MRDLSTRITFVTASLGTKWESYSQALLEANFPECQRVLVDGTESWTPLYFVDLSTKLRTDYMVLVDEDCFVFDREQLIELVDSLDGDEDTAVAASPDGGTFHRDYNPVACNTFFGVIRLSALREATRTDGWRSLAWGDVEGRVDVSHVGQLDRGRMNYQYEEPYHAFFWAILKAGFKIRYLLPRLNAELLASELRQGAATTPMALHMWWLRSWYVKTPEIYLGVSNRSRYALLEKVWLKPQFANPGMRLVLERHHAGRRSRASVRKVRGLARRLQARLFPGNPLQ